MFRLPTAVAALALSAGAAAALPIVGGITTVDVAPVAPALDSLGLSAAPFGSATADGTVFSFPITGGTAEGAVLTILHEGSGVTLSGGGQEATVGNFVIETATAQILGDVIGGPQDVPLFDFGDVGDDGIPLLVTAPLAQTLDAVFGSDDGDSDEFGLTGALFANAATAPDVVPVPAALPLLALGLAAMGAIGLRRRA